MLLLDGIQQLSRDSATAWVDHDKKTLFSDRDGRTPSWVGIEYMAQTIGMVSGYLRLSAGLECQIGFLLGTQKYTVETSHFEASERVEIEVRAELYDFDVGLASFRCEISSNEKRMASASIKAIQPPDLKQFLLELEG